MIFRPELIDKILSGKKTETRRPVKDGKPCRYEQGRTYSLQSARGKPGVGRIRVREVRRERLGEIDEDGAQREGFESRKEFFDYWKKLYEKVDEDVEVWVIHFKIPGGASLIALGAGAP